METMLIASLNGDVVGASVRVDAEAAEAGDTTAGAKARRSARLRPPDPRNPDRMPR